MKRLVTIVLLFLTSSAFAQEKLSIVQRAMRDELERNMKELKSEGFERPFFISYTLQDLTINSISATLGAITNSFEAKSRSALSVRLIVGDYEFNDESLDNNLFNQGQGNEIELPLDDDYLGIRRSLWLSTDNVYRSASRKFARNTELLKEQGKPLSEVPHRTFVKVAPSKVDIPAPEFKFDKGATEEYLRKLSAVFKEYEKITDSYVGFVYRRGYRYLVNSEGSINRVPVTMATLYVTASLRTSDDKQMFDGFHKQYSVPELPPVETLIAEARKVAESLVDSQKLPEFTEEYMGPVLFEGEQLANLMFREMFTRENSLVANNNIPSLKGARYESNFLDLKIGKPLFAEGMTVKATPKVKTFNGVPLFGSFEVDEEGVVPQDEIVLVENGVLKQMCNDRSMTRSDQIANGMSDGPGVVMASFKNAVPMATLKSKLIERARKEGLEYGIKVSIGRGNASDMKIYKVYVSDGHEELMREASMTGLEQRDFKKIVEASRELNVYNIDRADKIVSMICPQGVIFEEVEIKNALSPSLHDEEYVPSPLKK